MKKHPIFLLLAFTLLTLTSLVSCSKSNETSSQLKIRLTGAPYNAEEVNIDIKEVRVSFAKDTSAWVTLNTNSRIYNILTLQDNRDTLIANSFVSTDVVKELRLVLGTGNSIKINDVPNPLVISSGDESGLKININKRLNPGLNDLLIDFDADLSIIKSRKGVYKLKPVLRIKWDR